MVGEFWTDILNEHQLKFTSENICALMYVSSGYHFCISDHIFMVGVLTSSVRCNYFMDSNIPFIHCSQNTVTRGYYTSGHFI